MDFFSALKISASGLSAQRLRMNLISSNLANVNTTKTAEGGPYQRKEAVLASVPERQRFSEVLRGKMGSGIAEVDVVAVRPDKRDPILTYDPNHPDADGNGYVASPNISVVEEMVQMMAASRSYEAGVTAIQTAKQMASKAMEIGR